jgi:UDP-N-acetyl-D-mannosaminuronate dehydrogenase
MAKSRLAAAPPPPVVLLGCGATGLPLAVALAGAGCTVTGVDSDAALSKRLSQGVCDNAEDGLTAPPDMIVRRSSDAR